MALLENNDADGAMVTAIAENVKPLLTGLLITVMFLVIVWLLIERSQDAKEERFDRVCEEYVGHSCE